MTTETEDRRMMAFAFPDINLIEMSTVGYELVGRIQCTKGIPQTAVFSHAYMDHGKSIVYFVFFDDSFDVVPIGAKIPVGAIEWERDNSYWVSDEWGSTIKQVGREKWQQ